MLIINAEESGFSYSYTTVGAAGSDDWINILLEVGGAWPSATHTHARSLLPDVFMMFSEDPWTFHLSSLLPQWLLLTAQPPPHPPFPHSQTPSSPTPPSPACDSSFASSCSLRLPAPPRAPHTFSSPPLLLWLQAVRPGPWTAALVPSPSPTPTTLPGRSPPPHPPPPPRTRTRIPPNPTSKCLPPRPCPARSPAPP